MKREYLRIVVAFMLLLITTNQLFAQKEKLFEQTFSAKDKIRLKLVIGSCSIAKSTDGNIHVKVTYTYDEDVYDIQVKEKSKALELREKIYGEDARGDSEWILSIPDDLEIDLSTATGDLTVEGIKLEIEGNSGTGDIHVSQAKGEFELNTGTGNLEVQNSEGKFDLNSGTGKVNLKNCNGEFEANSGTNDVSGINLSITDEGDFNSGTGDVEIVDPAGEDYELAINSGTGDATLVLDKAPLKGYFEFKTNTGRIKAPVGFDEESEDEFDHDHTIRKSFTKEKKSPRYYISSGTGTASLKK